MSKRSCEYCKYLTDGCRCKARDERIISSTLFECGCIHFEELKQTVFDHITKNMETLAKKLVYEQVVVKNIRINGLYSSHINSSYIKMWKSALLPTDFFDDKQRALEATIKELKKEYKENE